MKKNFLLVVLTVFKKFYIVDKEEMSDLSKEKMEIVKTWGLQRQMKES